MLWSEYDHMGEGITTLAISSLGLEASEAIHFFGCSFVMPPAGLTSRPHLSVHVVPVRMDDRVSVAMSVVILSSWQFSRSYTVLVVTLPWLIGIHLVAVRVLGDGVRGEVLVLLIRLGLDRKVGLLGLGLLVLIISGPVVGTKVLGAARRAGVAVAVADLTRTGLAAVRSAGVRFTRAGAGVGHYVALVLAVHAAVTGNASVGGGQQHQQGGRDQQDLDLHHVADWS